VREKERRNCGGKRGTGWKGQKKTVSTQLGGGARTAPKKAPVGTEKDKKKKGNKGSTHKREKGDDEVWHRVRATTPTQTSREGTLIQKDKKHKQNATSTRGNTWNKRKKKVGKKAQYPTKKT